MKVKCISTKSIGREDEYDSLTPGKEYVVLSVEFYESDSLFSDELDDFVVYRIKDNDGFVMPYPSKLFDISSNKIPECWVAYQSRAGKFELLPGLWARKSFWEEYYNDDPIALEEFEKAEREILTQL
ncbi:MAG: hypothetical protein ACRCW0_03205 [Clostridium sp.]|uniref:hypothetical protein n=1 Tax=Paraclostridium bifermentans TaxID=1490 RepID=UPI00374FC496